MEWRPRILKIAYMKKLWRWLIKKHANFPNCNFCEGFNNWGQQIQLPTNNFLMQEPTSLFPHLIYDPYDIDICTFLFLMDAKSLIYQYHVSSWALYIANRWMSQLIHWSPISLGCHLNFHDISPLWYSHVSGKFCFRSENKSLAIFIKRFPIGTKISDRDSKNM